MKNCCEKKGIQRGIWLGILPHSFCIAFIVFSLIGSTLAASLFKKYLLTPYFFEMLVALSFVFATISAVIYLKKQERLSVRGVRENWGYLGILFGTTVTVNLLLFLVVFPLTTNFSRPNLKEERTGGTQKITLQVDLPCSGHAPLVGDEFKKTLGITDFRFSLPNVFWVEYNPSLISVDQILSLPVFGSFKARVVENG